MLDSGFSQRLAIAIGDESVNSFAQRAGVGESVLRSYLKGTVPRLDKIVAIAQAANVSLDWLATGNGSMTISRQEIETQFTEPAVMKLWDRLQELLNRENLSVEDTQKIKNLSESLKALNSKSAESA
jgi:transcriptional regulator with XRE-family HTH domain